MDRNYNRNDRNMKKDLRCITYDQLQIMNKMRNLWEQHIFWTRSFIVSAASGLPDLEFVTARLLRNPKDFAKELRPIYGDAKANEFERLFTEHLVIAADLVNNAKAGNAQAADMARRKWYNNAAAIADFLDIINPYWDAREWQSMLFEHLKLTEVLAVLRLNGRYAEDIMQSDRIEAQALEMADMMSTGIIKQFNI